MSADQALTRAQERMNSDIDAAVDSGVAAQLQKSMNVTLKLTSGRSVRLVSPDGVPTREGAHYYSKIAIDPPAIFPYEQGLLNGKMVSGWSASMARRRWCDVWEQMVLGR